MVSKNLPNLDYAWRRQLARQQLERLREEMRQLERRIAEVEENLASLSEPDQPR